MSTPTMPSAPAAPAAAPSAQANPGAAAAGVEKSQTPATEIRKMKLKLDGKEVELPESEVIAYAQQGKVATQRFQEAARMRQEAEQLLQFAKANPKEFFAKTGMNARQWAEEFLVGELQAEAMSPEQKKARENEEKLRSYEAAEKQRKDQERQEQIKRLEKEHMENYDRMFVQALNESGLPRTPFTIKRMAELQLINVKNKFELGPSQLAKLVREDYITEQKSLLGEFNGDQLLDFLGADLVKKLSKAQIAKLKARGSQPSAQPSRTQEQSAKESGLTWEEYKRRNRRLGR